MEVKTMRFEKKIYRRTSRKNKRTVARRVRALASKTVSAGRE
jgi:hypothetical protein